ncbi:MAG: hypothetical protein E7420_02265 [Ruminococcaceae bacterium]|nr:hypothetical protein [Oscillospiraceae bacterium]
METERLPEHREEKKPVQSGQWLWKNLKPFGCILCLVIMVLTVIICLTAGKDPIPDYEPPRDSDYYAENIEELAAELEENVFPHLEGVVGWESAGERLVITLEEDNFAADRSALLQYFDTELFEFVME